MFWRSRVAGRVVRTDDLPSVSWWVIHWLRGDRRRGCGAHDFLIDGPAEAKPRLGE